MFLPLARDNLYAITAPLGIYFFAHLILEYDCTSKPSLAFEEIVSSLREASAAFNDSMRQFPPVFFDKNAPLEAVYTAAAKYSPSPEHQANRAHAQQQQQQQQQQLETAVTQLERSLGL